MRVRAQLYKTIVKKIDSSKILIISLMSFFNLFSCQSNEITKDDKFWIWFSKNEKNIYENVDKENLREDIYDQIILPSFL